MSRILLGGGAEDEPSGVKGSNVELTGPQYIYIPWERVVIIRVVVGHHGTLSDFGA